ATLRQAGAEAYAIGEHIGLASDNLIVVARSGARDLMAGMNLSLTGSYIDTSGQSLEAYLANRPTDDPVDLLEETARDLFWREERRICDWDIPKLEPGKPSGFDFMDRHLRWTVPELVILVGPYGCGKSNLARLLAYKWADTIGRKIGLRASIVGWEDK